MVLAWSWLMMGCFYILFATQRALAGLFGWWFWVDVVGAAAFIALGVMKASSVMRARAIAALDAHTQAPEVDRWASLDAEIAMRSHDDVLRRLPDDVLAGLGYVRTNNGGVKPNSSDTYIAELVKDRERERERRQQQDWDRMAAAALTAGITHAELEQVKVTVTELLVAGTDVGIDYDDTTDRLTIQTKAVKRETPLPVPWAQRAVFLIEGRGRKSWVTKIFQEAAQLPVDGIWGRRTEAKFQELLKQDLVPIRRVNHGDTVDVAPGEMIRLPDGRVVAMSLNAGSSLVVSPCSHTSGLTRITSADRRADRLLCDECGVDINTVAKPTRPSPTEAVRW